MPAKIHRFHIHFIKVLIFSSKNTRQLSEWQAKGSAPGPHWRHSPRFPYRLAPLLALAIER